MFKLYKSFALGIIIFTSAILSGCSEESTTGTNNTQYLATQSDLNNATNLYEGNVTGRKYGDASVAHNGTTLPPDSTFRDIYGTNSNKSDEIKKGTIIAKHVFIRNSDGSKGNLQVTFAMIKREAGYDAANKDWEYVMMPFDAGNNYNQNPNGILPDASNANARGKLSLCIGCHSVASGGDFLFFN